jgi:hypothetical protein
MKYIISENRLTNAIINYFNEKYGNLKQNDYNCSSGFNLDTESNTIFHYHKKCFYQQRIKNSKTKDEFLYFQSRMEKSPLLVFYNQNDYKTLNGYFDDLWKPIFKKWFEEKYGLEIKTILLIFN